MKILHIIPSVDPKSGGPAKAVVSYANLASSFAEVHLLAMNEGFEEYGDVEEIKKAIGLKPEVGLTVFDYLGRHSYKYSKPFKNWLENHIANFDVAHLHAAFSLMITISAKVCKEYGKPYVFRPLGTLSRYSLEAGSSRLKKLYYRFLERKTLLNANAIQTTSPQESEDIRQLMGSGTDISVIPIPMPSQNKRAAGRHSDIMRIGYLGRIHPKKNLENLLKSVFHFSKDNSIILYIAGEGQQKYKYDLKKLATDLNIDTHVDWLGFIEGAEKEEFFEDIDYFVSPSFHENFGVSVIEALSYGRPVLLSREIDAIHWVEKYQCGLECGVEETDILIALNKALFIEEEAYTNMSRNGLRMVENEFSPEKIIQKLKQLYGAAS